MIFHLNTRGMRPEEGFLRPSSPIPCKTQDGTACSNWAGAAKMINR
jgi:hypothetical protein